MTAPADTGEPRDERRRVDELTSELEAALAERNALWAAAQRTRALELELEHARAIIAEMKRSASWRLTTPLRGVKGQTQAKKKTAGRIRRAVRGT